MFEWLHWFWKYQVLARTSPRREGCSWACYKRLKAQGLIDA